MTGLCSTCARVANTIPDAKLPDGMITACAACGGPSHTLGPPAAAMAAITEYAERLKSAVRAAMGRGQPAAPEPSGLLQAKLQPKGQG